MSAMLERRPAAPAKTHVPLHRLEALHEMLLRYNEARSEANGPGEGGAARSEARLNVFDETTWTREYRELERCLERLRDLAEHGRPMIEPGVSSAKAWWSIRERYLNAQTIARDVHLRKTHSGARVPTGLPRNSEIVSRAVVLHGRTSRMMVRTWDPGVDPRVVEAALRWIAREYRGTPAVYSVA